jgi:hypothetical protein
MSKKTITGNILLLVITLLVATLLAEIILRQIRPVDAGKSGHFRIPHPVFGWVLEPGASFLNPMQESTVSVTYNSRGWRDTEHTEDNQDNVTRLLVLGDSYMDAYSVSAEDATPKQLQQLALDNKNEIEVINLGVGGYGTLQEYLVFRDIGIKYQPDIVLLGFYLYNDVRNNSLALESLLTPESMKTQSRPFLEPGEVTNWELTMVDFESAQTRFNKARKEKDTIRKISGNSALYMEILKLMRKNNNDTDNDNYPDTELEETTKHLVEHGVQYCREPSEYTAAWNLTRRILMRLNREIVETGARLLVFSVPAIQDVNIRKMNKVMKKSPKDGLLCLHEAPGYTRLAGILEELQIDYLDLLPKFRKETQSSGTNLFRESDRHWNEAGHKLAAENILSALYKNHILKSPMPSGK